MEGKGKEGGWRGRGRREDGGGGEGGRMEGEGKEGGWRGREEGGGGEEEGEGKGERGLKGREDGGGERVMHSKCTPCILWILSREYSGGSEEG